jgi:HK97 family phage portal protein
MSASFFMNVFHRLGNFAENFGNLFAENRSTSSIRYNGNNIDNWDELTGTSSYTNAGITISPANADCFTAVYSAKKIISESIANLPLRLMKRKDGRTTEATDHNLYEMLMKEPNDFMTWFTFKETLVNNALTWGNGFARIFRNGAGQPIQLQILENFECTPYYLKQPSGETLYYYVFGQLVEKRDMIHITCIGSNGIIGKSPISIASESIALGIQAQNTMSKFYKGNLKSKAVFSTQGELSDPAYDRLNQSIKDSMRGDKDFFLLENGNSVTTLTMSPQDAETLATRKFQVEEVARMYRVPLHKLQSLDRSTNNNIEQQSDDFKVDCLLPWSEKIEQEFKRKLLLNRDKPNHWFNLDIDYVLRADSVSRSVVYMNRFKTGSITGNMIREREGENRIDNPMCDLPFVGSGDMPLDQEIWNAKKLDNKIGA